MSLFKELPILPKDGDVLFFENFFSSFESDHYFQTLIENIKWKHEPIFLFGKEVMQPRLTAWYGDTDKDLKYSGIVMKPYAWTKPLLEIKRKVEATAGVNFTSVLLNQYRNENDSVGWHKDDEKELGKNPTIASVSFGATRTFLFKHDTDKNLKASVELSHGSLLLMKGETQHHWYHSIPKRLIKLGPRINLTFRVIY